MLPSVEVLTKALNPDMIKLIGGDSISLEMFLTMYPQQWLAD